MKAFTATIHEDLIFTQMDPSGGLDLYLHLSNCSIDEELEAAIAAWDDSDLDEVNIQVHFKAADILGSIIDGWSTSANRRRLNADAKPMVNALKADLLAMLARIETLEFSPDPLSEYPWAAP